MIKEGISPLSSKTSAWPEEYKLKAVLARVTARASIRFRRIRSGE